MSAWLEYIIVGVLILLALAYITLTVIKKFKRPNCGDDCACGAKKLFKRK